MIVWERAIETERMRTKEEEERCYLGRVAVWGCLFLQRCHLVLMTQCSARRVERVQKPWEQSIHLENF